MESASPNLSVQNMPIVQIHHYAEKLNGTLNTGEIDKYYQDDAVWIITSSFIIFTMHSGFGLLESGSVSAKDEVNIMVKNVVDVVFGGLSYWSVGYGLSYGDWHEYRNRFVGVGRFFYDPSEENSVNSEGWSYAAFLFQLSLATTASTIVSGAVAERAKLKSYILLGCLVIIIQALPAHWVWDPEGFLFQMGVVDFAGCSAVHMVGGIIGLIATVYLKPRRNRFNEDSVHQMSSPTNALLGTFLLWWGWFGINAGSVWGITSGRWRLGARAAVATIMSSIGGGATSIVISFSKTRKLQVNYLINGILSSIVSITAMCAVSRPWHALIIGSVSSAFSISVLPLLERLKIDDPVGIVPIHLTSSIWGMLAVGLFCEEDKFLKMATSRHAGLLYSGGDPTLLFIQLLATVTILTYSAVLGLLVLWLISKSPLGLRVTDYEEQIGADVIEHGLAGTNVARYVIEKPLSTRTFQTVTKAIAKWKMLAKTKSRSKRMENARQRRLEEEKAAANATEPVANGGPVANGAVHRRITRANGSMERRTHTTIQIEPRTARETIYRQPISARSNASRQSAPPGPSLPTDHPGEQVPTPPSSPVPLRNESVQDGSRAETEATNGTEEVTRSSSPGSRPTTTSNSVTRSSPANRFFRSPNVRVLTPPSDASAETVTSSRHRSNRVAPQ